MERHLRTVHLRPRHVSVIYLRERHVLVRCDRSRLVMVRHVRIMYITVMYVMVCNVREIHVLQKYQGKAPCGKAIVDNVKLLPLPQPSLCACMDAQTNPSAQRATQLRRVLARVYAVSRQNQITTTVP
jgi:hypothetical protein